jgi:hypothetical protein
MSCVSPLRIKGGVLGYTWILSSTEAGRISLACSGTRRLASHHGRRLASDDGAYLFYVRVHSFAVLRTLNARSGSNTGLTAGSTRDLQFAASTVSGATAQPFSRELHPAVIGQPRPNVEPNAVAVETAAFGHVAVQRRCSPATLGEKPASAPGFSPRVVLWRVCANTLVRRKAHRRWTCSPPPTSIPSMPTPHLRRAQPGTDDRNSPGPERVALATVAGRPVRCDAW